MKSEWARKWPTELGWYWFYGDPHSKKSGDKFKRLYPVKVNKIINGLSCVVEGHYMFKSEASDGLWTKMIVPEKPEENNL